ncbi:MAG: DUF3857 domain-containing protein, partial [Candidatus Electryoneaceae bacterium]|nr:DUF3857 domain-containing protein [Candidatus Electryoneaceae bacterium]
MERFTVRELRTLRDGQWWESDTTGIVETSPHAVRTAYDYNDRREMMLLHDGVELPCILNVEYVIEDKIPFRNGVEGMWLFAKDDPVLESHFSFDVPIGLNPQVFASEGVQVDEIGTD